jgi:hypothetical protein
MLCARVVELNLCATHMISGDIYAQYSVREGAPCWADQDCEASARRAGDMLSICVSDMLCPSTTSTCTKRCMAASMHFHNLNTLIHIFPASAQITANSVTCVTSMPTRCGLGECYSVDASAACATASGTSTCKCVPAGKSRTRLSLPKRVYANYTQSL